MVFVVDLNNQKQWLLSDEDELFQALKSQSDLTKDQIDKIFEIGKLFIQKYREEHL